MSKALREYESGSSMDIPKVIFKFSLWSWFLYRFGEQVLYYLLEKFKIPHTPKWIYDHNKKYSENIEEKDKWKKKKLLL